MNAHHLAQLGAGANLVIGLAASSPPHLLLGLALLTGCIVAGLLEPRS